LGLKRLGLNPLPSVGNFVTARTTRVSVDVIADLRDHGILIAGVPGPGYENAIRITVGTADDTDAVLTALEVILAL
jgi:histidinol-phosphate aminotransferase